MPNKLAFREWVSPSVLVLALALASGTADSVRAQQEAEQPQQEKFASASEAVAALADALRKDDLQALESVLGPDSADIIDSGDAVADKNARDDFLEAYQAKSNLVPLNDNTTSLQIGNDDWPFPIPLVKEGESWRFDTDAGHDELINRRIGRNEANAVEASLAFIDAQREYASVDRDGDGILEYAQHIRSTSGMRDGLYWPVQPGEPQSPLGPLFAEAQAEGYRLETPQTANAPSTPQNAYYGYFYKILTAQGPSAPGGAYPYIVDGSMLGGVGLIAYPAAYGDSGIMSFIVNHEGVVHQKDLGPETLELGASMTTFDPDSSWMRVDTETPVAGAP